MSDRSLADADDWVGVSISGGPQRVYDSDTADPEYVVPPVAGFARPLPSRPSGHTAAAEPLLWEGGQA